MLSIPFLDAAINDINVSVSFILGKNIRPNFKECDYAFTFNKLVDKDFNTKSFINYHDYESDEAVIERIIELDRNDDLYLECLKQPYYNNNVVNEYIRRENISDQFITIFEKEKLVINK